MKTLIAYLTVILLFLTTTATLAQTKADDALLLDMYQSQRYAEAAAYLKNIYTEPITDTRALSRLGYTFQMAGKLADAEAYYQRLYQIDSTNVSTLFSLAGINSQRENKTKALYFYERITTLDRTNFRAFKQVGLLYRERNDTLKALKNLQTANKLNPEDPDVAAELSFVLSGLKHTKQAETVLNRALKADSASLFLLRCLVNVTYNAEEYNETIKTCNKMMDLGDQSAQVLKKLGASYYMIKNYECCIETFALMQDIFKTEREYYFTAESYKALKQYHKAIDYFELTLRESISPNTNLYYSEMADSYDELHQLKSTIANYQKSLFFKEKDMVLYALANLYDSKLKDKRNALKYYKKYLESKPPAIQKAYIEYVQSRVAALQGNVKGQAAPTD
ncbi:hypothetical protein BEL04_04270 [Mucilaginibacter sp. PPCGB 2223]|uniref:tetratricopeptide repeat protein n=1 Tax=Mucilaginibacter sp. PPCGB 2223 TaxID=1886027 RepID=UPI000823FD92|nr:tetratricopeptide repeat protein [Mucilaginibacter sp. PPCGB 2223]OCX53522.1 hypothetical protein BEL04_04270 [Mucilaginibacter sp. PPCGB 2223]